MSILRRLTLTLSVVALLAAAAFGTGWVLQRDDDTAPAAQERAAGQRPGNGSGPGREEGRATDSSSEEPSDAPSETPSDEPDADEPDADEPSAPSEPDLVAGPALMGPGDENDDVRELQARLRQIQWFNQDVTGLYGPVTTEAVKGFQAKREIPVTGEVDQRTMHRLLAMTTEPTKAELANELGQNEPGPLDPRCLQGHVLCIDKTSSTLRWVVDGDVQTTLDVRFGAEYTPTREGAFKVDFKSRDHVSSLYGSAMPFSMFFSRGQAVHYSSDFAARGYAGASHGCVNVRDYDALAALFDQVDVGDPVIVYRS